MKLRPVNGKEAARNLARCHIADTCEDLRMRFASYEDVPAQLWIYAVLALLIALFACAHQWQFARAGCQASAS
jgi:hypothetical protein